MHAITHSPPSPHPAVRHLAVALIGLAVATAAPVSTAAPEPVDINSADAKTMAKGLKGVGMKLARRIVEFREMYGPFPSVEALAEVRGIGRKVLTKNESRLIAVQEDKEEMPPVQRKSGQ